MSAHDHLNPAQFYHGTNTELEPGSQLTIEAAKSRHFENNSKGHLHFSEYKSRGADYAEGRSGDYGGSPRVYEVQPQGEYERDPNDQGGSYRTKHPVNVIREVPEHEWDDDL